MVISNKQYKFRFLDKAGVYIGSPSSISISGFRKIINGGLGDLTLDLAIPFDKSYTSPYTTLFNRVEVRVIDGDTDRDGVLIYSGFVNERNPHVDEATEGVTITCRGHASRFASLPLKNGTTTVLRTDTAAGLTTGAVSAAAVDLVLKTIIDRYNAEATYPVVNYTTSPASVAAAGVNLTYPFTTKTIQFAIDTAMQVAPAQSYWRVGADNVFRFGLLGTTYDHLLAFGSQIVAFSDSERMDGMVNRFHFAYNGNPPTGSNVYHDDPSATSYGDWWKFKTDGNYTVAGDASNLGYASINANKNPLRRVIIRVADNNSASKGISSRVVGYDTELFEPGQMVRITNLPPVVQQNFPSLLQIVAVDYSLDNAQLELVSPLDDLAREYARKERQDIATTTDSNPSTYTLA